MNLHSSILISKKWIFMFFLVFSCSLIYAGNWEEIAKDNKGIWFIDRNTLSVNKNTRKIFLLHNFHKGEFVSGVSSHRYLYEFDCNKKLMRLLERSDWSGIYASLKNIYTSPGDRKWDSPQPGSGNSQLIDLVCGI